MADTNNELVNAVLGEKPGEAVIGNGRGSALCNYWKRPDGWLVVIAAHPKTDAPTYSEFIAKGFKPLPYSFGVEEAYKGNMLGGDSTRQFEKFIAAGGLDYIDNRGEFGPAGEYLMPSEQLIAMGWHRRPAVQAIRPDLAGVVDIPCPHKCLDKITGKVTLFASQRLLDKHLDSDPQHRAAQPQYVMAEALTKSFASVPVVASSDAEVAALRAELAELRALVRQNASAPPPPIPAAPASLRYPDGSPDESWSRQNLMAWAKDNGYSAALSPSLNTAETLAAINNARLVSAGT